jgi:hypothetical protein
MEFCHSLGTLREESQHKTMLLSQFAHGRSQLPFFTSNLTVSSGGNTTAVHTLYLSIQGENPVGVNLPSALVPVTVAAGQKLTVTLPQIVWELLGKSPNTKLCSFPSLLTGDRSSHSLPAI